MILFITFFSLIRLDKADFSILKAKTKKIPKANVAERHGKLLKLVIKSTGLIH